MKFHSNLLITASLAATLTLMAACAPAKKSANFKDRSGAKSGATVGQLFFINKGESAEDKEFAKSITFVGAIVEEAANTNIARQKLNEKYKKRDTTKLSKHVPLPEEGATAIATNQPNNRRQETLISVRVVVEGIGGLDYMGYNDEFGSEKILTELSAANEECAAEVAGFLSVRAACVDRACSKLAVQLVKVMEDKELYANKLLDKVGQPTGSSITVTQYKELASDVDAPTDLAAETDADESTEEQSKPKAKKPMPQMVCKAKTAEELALEKKTAEETAANKAVEEERSSETEEKKPEIDLADLLKE